MYPVVKELLREKGFSMAAWSREVGNGSGVWSGDLCGCSDDRCIGYHHEENESCECLRALLDDVLTARDMPTLIWWP